MTRVVELDEKNLERLVVLDPTNRRIRAFVELSSVRQRPFGVRVSFPHVGPNGGLGKRRSLSTGGLRQRRTRSPSKGHQPPAMGQRPLSKGQRRPSRRQLSKGEEAPAVIGRDAVLEEQRRKKPLSKKRRALPRGRSKPVLGWATEVTEREIRLVRDGKLVAFLVPGLVDGSLCLCCQQGVSLSILRMEATGGEERTSPRKRCGRSRDPKKED